MPKRSQQMTEDVWNYQGELIALSGDLQRVVGYGQDPIKMAKEAGEEHAFLYFVPKEGTVYI